jgi:hypothetical protein
MFPKILKRIGHLPNQQTVDSSHEIQDRDNHTCLNCRASHRSVRKLNHPVAHQLSISIQIEFKSIEQIFSSKLKAIDKISDLALRTREDFQHSKLSRRPDMLSKGLSELEAEDVLSFGVIAFLSWESIITGARYIFSEKPGCVLENNSRILTHKILSLTRHDIGSQ